VLVDLVRDHPQLVLLGPRTDRRDLLFVVNRTRRVGGRHEEKHFCPGAESGIELFEVYLVATLGSRRHLDGHPSGEPNGLWVSGPIGRGQQDLVAGVEQGGKDLLDGLLAAVGDEDLRCVNREPGVASSLDRDGLTQLRETGGRRVLVVLRVSAGGHGRLDDVSRRREVGLTGTEADHVLPGRPERFGFGVDGESGGLSHGGDPGRNAL
jgi:hypothetical protein